VLATARLGTELALVVAGSQLPVIASAARQSMDRHAALAMTSDACGVVVPPEDPLAMAQALLALAADAALREQLGAAGRAHALAHMDRDAVLRQFESALMAVTAKN
jgi:colanic acid biosynthesis glycosyl transferase WcaI